MANPIEPPMSARARRWLSARRVRNSPLLRHTIGRADEIVLEGVDPMQVTGHDLADGRLSMSGWTSGVAQDSEDTLNSKPNPTPNRSPNRPALGCSGNGPAEP
jgi:hypothetical protein